MGKAFLRSELPIGTESKQGNETQCCTVKGEMLERMHIQGGFILQCDVGDKLLKCAASDTRSLGFIAEFILTCMPS